MRQDVESSPRKSRYNKTTVRRYGQDETLAPVQLHIDDQKLLRELNRVAVASRDKLYTSTARRALSIGVQVLLQQARQPLPSVPLADHPT